jgi:hypothetical protein
MRDYRANPDQWAYQEHWAAEDGDAACMLELRTRVERLELGAGIHDAVAKELRRSYPAKSDSSLVERVQQAINTEYEESLGTGSMEARAAIREVAAWLREQPGDVRLFNAGLALDKEAER